MAGFPRGIDHLLVGARDLDGAAADFARLGFTLTPRGRHLGWATANRCVMFADGGYVELLAVVDPEGFTNGLDRELSELGEGGFGLALMTDDPNATRRRWEAAGLPAGDPVELGRALDDGTVLRFVNVPLPREATGPVRAFACRALEPEALRRPAWLFHANTAVGLASATLIADEPRGSEALLRRLFGPGSVTATDDTLAVHTGRGLLLVTTPEDAGHLHPALADADLAAGRLAVATLRVADPARTAACLAEAGVPFRRGPGGALGVAPGHARGLAVEFVPAGSSGRSA